MKLERLHGDASYRTYFRGKKETGSSFIVMQMPPGKMSVSEEITNLKSKPTELPFLNVQRFLKSHGLPVPEVYEFRPSESQIFLEDLGDISLEKLLQTTDDWKIWYQKAIDLLIQIQSLPTNQREQCIALQRSFDATLYNWEFDHFWKFFVETRDLRPETRDPSTLLRTGSLRAGQKLFETETRKITKVLLQEPLIFTHRDFQSRNLMVQGERLRLIDFQDALLGPPQYDLVALLRDSYVELEWGLVEELIDYYLRKMGGDPERFRKLFDYVTIQRKLKDAGRFVYIDRVKKNPSFLKHIPTSLKYVKGALERQGELKPLFDMLRRYVPEFN